MLHGEIHTIDRFEEMQKWVRPDTWVICDIDGVLIDAAQMLGSTHWLYDHLHHLVHEEGMAPAQAAFAFEQEYGHVRATVPYVPMEESIPQTIAALQSKGHTVFALSHRPLSMYTATEKHLASVNIDFRPTSPLSKDHWFSDLSRMHDGVLFVSDFGPKGRTLALLLNYLGTTPPSIVFIDDSEHNVKSVHATCEELGIPCHACYYQLRKRRHANYSREIADIQLAALPEILSDHEATLSLRYRQSSHTANQTHEENRKWIKLTTTTRNRSLKALCARFWST